MKKNTRCEKALLELWSDQIYPFRQRRGLRGVKYLIKSFLKKLILKKVNLIIETDEGSQYTFKNIVPIKISPVLPSLEPNTDIMSQTIQFSYESMK